MNTTDKILNILKNKSKHATGLASGHIALLALISDSTARKHLKKLREEGKVKWRKVGGQMIYSLPDPVITNEGPQAPVVQTPPKDTQVQEDLTLNTPPRTSATYRMGVVSLLRARAHKHLRAAQRAGSEAKRKQALSRYRKTQDRLQSLRGF